MREHWDSVFKAKPDRFGSEPSFSAKRTGETLARLGVVEPQMLDLGSGTGRDARFFSQLGMRVVALDFSQVALDELQREPAIVTVRHDVRTP